MPIPRPPPCPTELLRRVLRGLDTTGVVFRQLVITDVTINGGDRLHVHVPSPWDGLTDETLTGSHTQLYLFTGEGSLATLRTVVRRPLLTLRAGRVFTSSYLMLGRGQALVSACEANVMLTLRCAGAKGR